MFEKKSYKEAHNALRAYVQRSIILIMSFAAIDLTLLHGGVPSASWVVLASVLLLFLLLIWSVLIVANTASVEYFTQPLSGSREGMLQAILSANPSHKITQSEMSKMKLAQYMDYSRHGYFTSDDAPDSDWKEHVDFHVSVPPMSQASVSLNKSFINEDLAKAQTLWRQSILDVAKDVKVWTAMLITTLAPIALMMFFGEQYSAYIQTVFMVSSAMLMLLFFGSLFNVHWFEISDLKQQLENMEPVSVSQMKNAAYSVQVNNAAQSYFWQVKNNGRLLLVGEYRMLSRIFSHD